ncbi:uncharacterized protein LOC133891950 [Phragmites australis]|uniref:uncharacterized protein LOC133891950 n=1 Tax=Phragmites australis TaxID=29695 RepID=UPI002D77155D|nr:uncharacterized protein LOC133891950 [Phragmites australis]
MTMDDMVSSLHVEQKARAKDVPLVNEDDNSRVNLIDTHQRRNKKNPKEYSSCFKPRGKIDKGNSKRNSKGINSFFECGKPGHFTGNCCYKKINEKVQKDKPEDQIDVKVNMVIDEAEVVRNNKEVIL